MSAKYYYLASVPPYILKERYFSIEISSALFWKRHVAKNKLYYYSLETDPRVQKWSVTNKICMHSAGFVHCYVVLCVFISGIKSALSDGHFETFIHGKCQQQTTIVMKYQYKTSVLKILKVNRLVRIN